jgi:hypothetical protein
MDFWRFNGQTRTWNALDTGPAVRWLHCIEYDQRRDQLVLFGGTNSSVKMNDLWTYSIKSERWLMVTPVGTSTPAARIDHACAFNTQSSMFHVHGGWGSQTYQDLWHLDFISNSWTLINLGDSNVLRIGHSMLYSKSLNSFFLIHGFNVFTNSFTNTAYQYSFKNQSAGWTLFEIRGSQRIPSIRGYYSTGFNNQSGEHYVFGGFDGTTYFSIYIS